MRATPTSVFFRFRDITSITKIRLRLVFTIALSSLIVPKLIQAQDTTFYPNGTIKEICAEGNSKRECTYFESNGSKLKTPHTIQYSLLKQQGVDFNIKTITQIKPISAVQLWRISRLLHQEYYYIDKQQSFSILINDTLSSYFLSTAKPFGVPAYLIYLNDSSYVKFKPSTGHMVEPSTLAISFKDFDKNGRTDIAYIVSFTTGAGSIRSRHKENYDAGILLNKEDRFDKKYIPQVQTIKALIQKYDSE
jgi:hypothetical protein